MDHRVKVLDGLWVGSVNSCPKTENRLEVDKKPNLPIAFPNNWLKVYGLAC